MEAGWRSSSLVPLDQLQLKERRHYSAVDENNTQPHSRVTVGASHSSLRVWWDLEGGPKCGVPPIPDSEKQPRKVSQGFMSSTSTCRSLHPEVNANEINGNVLEGRAVSPTCDDDILNLANRRHSTPPRPSRTPTAFGTGRNTGRTWNTLSTCSPALDRTERLFTLGAPNTLYLRPKTDSAAQPYKSTELTDKEKCDIEARAYEFLFGK